MPVLSVGGIPITLTAGYVVGDIAGGGGGGPVTYSGPFRSSLGDTGGTSFAVDMGPEAPDRLLLVALTGVLATTPSLVSASVNGQSTTATLLRGVSDDVHIWFVIEAPLGAGSQTVSFTLDTTLFEAVRTAWVVRGADVASVQVQYASDDSFGFQASTSLTVTDDGAIFSAASLFTGQSPSFAGSTAPPNVSASIETTQRGQYALDLDGLVAGTFITQQDTNFCFAMSSVTFSAG